MSSDPLVQKTPRPRKPRALAEPAPAATPLEVQPPEAPQPRLEDPLPPSAFLNREMSWLEFNQRVLWEAQNPRNPPVERLKFCAIVGSNLDEFFMVRVAGIHRQIAAGVSVLTPDGLLPQQGLEQIRERTRAMMNEAQLTLREVMAALPEQGVNVVRYEELSLLERNHLRETYLREIHPVLTPLAVDPSHPFPYISNLSLNLAVILEDEEGPEFARVKVPVGVLPRTVTLPSGAHMLLEDVIAAHLPELFRGREVQASYPFRVTRNTDYEFDEDEAEDLLATIEDGLRRRRFGAVVRLEVSRDMPAGLLEELRTRLHLAEPDVFELDGPLGSADLMGLALAHEHLGFPPFAPHVPDLEGDEDIFCTLRTRDVLLHHPYESFEAVLNLIEAAAADPEVLTIKQTLYRTGGDPRLLRALETAAEAGKQVVALVELKARFDEQRNIRWARMLERAGVHVVYGIAGLKTHAKVTLIVRREPGGLRRYVHVGTGNYNPRTARLYTDFSLLTADPQVGEDVSELFNHLTGYAEAEYGRILVAPYTMREDFYALIEREIGNARAGRPSGITAKMNSLTDPGMIAELYRASQAGVPVRLIIRGVCCLRPGVEGLSENITVRSQVGRFLEHARVYAFENGGDPEIFIGSADWMSRNLNRRVEVVTSVQDSQHRAYLREILELQLEDAPGAWQLGPDGKYRRMAEEGISAQERLMLRHGHLIE
ncbi:polyphosphate kinase [Deinobacterium chartae]|uniref:Polyphosphate kinase n=1 Tax=Deinobacterium chartae TaxID=521158 RepID=A0A841I6H8_9DEIO|nr:polyphosphate kinase 1 [Deinobacterium chartae]MBB6100098.1 polyphosphate kinase [Deinobacterium chartae]